nr:segregation/condensation protein A [Steroidobacter sp.]
MSKAKSKPELKLVEDTGSQLEAEDFAAELPPQQSEMPFAVVEGEPVTELPRDLYIPPDALQVFLEAFEGPLDLLLYLIRKQNLDILDIPIAEITRQYMKYIEVMADLQLELAGEYLLMAAMLAEIKSRMLLPRPPAAEGQDEDDPRAELVRRLQEYERFKKAAEDLDHLTRLDRDTMPASAELEERQVLTRLPDVTLKEMLDAFRDVLSRAEKFAHHHISRERLSQRERMTEILDRLQTVAFFEFTQLFRPEEGRMGVTVTFIAILELMKEGLIEIVQAEAYAPIHVRTAQRHLKVVQGGAASETADAENVAALAQPELAGENDIPDEFEDEPKADPAATAVEAAVADVAAASSIAADSFESDGEVADSGFVDAAVSEAVASTSTAVDVVADEVAVSGELVVIDEPVDASLDAVVDAIAAQAPLDVTAVEDPLAAVSAADHFGGVQADETTLEDVPADAHFVDESAVESVAAVHAHVVEEHVIEEHEVEEHIVPEHVVEEHVIPAPVPLVEESVAQVEPVVEQSFAQSEQLVEQSFAPTEPVVELSFAQAESVVTENFGQPDPVADENVAPAEPAIEQNLADAEPAVAESFIEAEPVIEDDLALAESAVDQNFSDAEPVVAESFAEAEPVIEDNLAPAEPVIEQNLADAEPAVAESFIEAEPVIEDNLAPAEPVIEQNFADAELAAEEIAAPIETVDTVDELSSLAEPVTAVDDSVALSETVEVVTAEPIEQIVAADVSAESIEQVSTTAEFADAAAAPAETVDIVDEAIEPVTDDTANIADDAVESDDLTTTDVVAEDAAGVDTAETAEQGESAELGEQANELSVDDDSVTGSSSEADNSDAEPSR